MSETPRVRRQQAVKQNEGTVVRGKSHKQSGQVVSQSETVERFVGVDELTPAYVTVGGKVTKNLGNYESVQIAVSVTLPCAPTDEDVRKTRVTASDMVEEFIDLELKSIGQ